jgi:chaperonin GroES
LSKDFEKVGPMKIVPLYHNIVVEPQEDNIYAELRARGSGLVIPDTIKDKPTQGRVVAIGGGRILQNGAISALRVQVGNIVVFNKYGGTELQYGDKHYIVLSEDQVHAVLIPEPSDAPAQPLKQSNGAETEKVTNADTTQIPAGVPTERVSA